MVDRRARNINTASIATQTLVGCNATTSTTLVPANEARSYFSVWLEPDDDFEAVFIKLQAASVDNNKVGIVLYRNTAGDTNLLVPKWEMPTGAIYTGEISAITDSATVDLYVTEY